MTETLIIYRLVNTCKCFDPDLPYDYDTIVFNHIEKAKGPCKLTNSTNGKLEKFASTFVSLKLNI